MIKNLIFRNWWKDQKLLALELGKYIITLGGYYTNRNDFLLDILPRLIFIRNQEYWSISFAWLFWCVEFAPNIS